MISGIKLRRLSDNFQKVKCWLSHMMPTGSEHSRVSMAHGRASHHDAIATTSMLQSVSVPCAQLGRAVLQPDQAASAGGHTPRQARGELPRLHPACLDTPMAAR